MVERQSWSIIRAAVMSFATTSRRTTIIRCWAAVASIPSGSLSIYNNTIYRSGVFSRATPSCYTFGAPPSAVYPTGIVLVNNLCIIPASSTAEGFARYIDVNNGTDIRNVTIKNNLYLQFKRGLVDQRALRHACPSTGGWLRAGLYRRPIIAGGECRLRWNMQLVATARQRPAAVSVRIPACDWRSRHRCGTQSYAATP